MSKARLTSVAIENFKSYSARTAIPLELLTVIVGRNNSGKSSVMQALLMLKQTLEFARLDVPLRLEGYVEAYSIRELTFGWPEATDTYIPGPAFEIEWQSTIDVASALSKLDDPDLSTLVSMTNLQWLLSYTGGILTVNNVLRLEYGEYKGATVLNRIVLQSEPNELHPDFASKVAEFRFERETEGEGYVCYFDGAPAKQLEVSLEHFLPYVAIDRRNVGPRHRQRSWANAFYILFVESLDDLKKLIKGFSFLSSTRALPKSIYGPSPTDDVGISGELAAQLLQAHQSDVVHYMLPNFANPSATPELRESKLSEAVNDVLFSLGVDSKVSIEEIKNAGFRLLFGKANLQHVGRGLTYLLPLVELGLIGDPLRFSRAKDLTAEKYSSLSYSLCAFEEPEAHLHPKVQSRLAQWFVALAMGQRQVIVETHSDHLVRKLRALVAGATRESLSEQWLLTNVRLVHVAQVNGTSTLTTTKLTKDGNIEIWPADFMDESTEAEQEIYLASMGKLPETSETSISKFDHRAEGEPSEGNS